MAAWRLRKVHNAASRFTGATPFANWRDEVDSLREAHKWDQALETYRRLAKDKDPSLYTLVLGQKAYDEEDLATARKEWTSLAEKGGGADDFPHYEAKALLGFLALRENDEEQALSYFETIASFLEQVEEAVMKDSLFTSYRFSLLTEAVFLLARHSDTEKALALCELVENVTIRYQKVNSLPLCESAQVQYSEALYHRTHLTHTEDYRASLLAWREALHRPIAPTQRQQGRVLRRIAEVCLYYFQCNAQYPPSECPTKVDFVPSSAVEEGVLAAVLCEDAMEMSKDDREAETLFDDLLVGLCSQAASAYGIKCMERGVITFDSEHLWTQFVLCLLNGGKEARALAVIDQILEINPQNTLMLLLGTKICINLSGDLQKAAKYAQQALQLTSEHEPSKRWAARAAHYMGVCYSALALQVTSVERMELHRQALHHYELAKTAGAQDYLFLFHQASEQAEIRNIPAAQQLVQQALDLHEHYAPTWMLLILLLTSQKLYEEAAGLCRAAMKRFQDPKLWYLSARIDVQLDKIPSALKTLRALCHLLQKLTPRAAMAAPRVEIPEETLLSPRARNEDSTLSESRSATLPPTSDSESTQVQHDYRVASPRNEQKAGQFDVYLLLARIFGQLGQREDAQMCLDEATQLHPYHPQVLYQQGQMHEKDQLLPAAAQLYRRALCFDPNHEASLLALAAVSLQLNDEESQSYITSAVRRFPFAPRGWLLMSQLMSQTGDHAAATSATNMYLDLEDSQPLLPFSWLAREL